MRELAKKLTNIRINALGLIFLGWLGYVSILVISQYLHLGFGYHIWPQGEDRNWLSMLQNSPSANMVKDFWKLDGRNPLSAWYWHLAAPIILQSSWGLYLLSLLINPLLAITVFLLLEQLGKKQNTTFSLCTALLVLAWNFTLRFDNSPITSYLALASTLLTLFFYCRFIDNKSTNNFDSMLALIFYFVAFTTYTLQSGAIIGVFLLGVWRREGDRKQALLAASKDALPFLVLFGLYNLIWYETTPLPSEVFFHLDFKKVLSLFYLSLRKFIFPPSLEIFWQLLLVDWTGLKIVGMLFTGMLAFLLLLTNPIARRNQKSTKTPYGWAMMILISIALPTAVVEATSSIFVPGDRSYFQLQVFQPILMTTLIFAILNASVRNTKLRFSLIVTAISLLGSLIFSFNLDYNHRLLKRSHYQMRLASLLRNIPVPANKPIYFLIKADRNGNANIGTEPALKSYATTALLNKDTFIRVISESKAPRKYAATWKVIFTSNGVANAGLLFDDTKIPYANILILSFDGKKIYVPRIVDKEFFQNLQIEWRRTQPITQPLY